jgi:hypothetical protein
MIHTAKSTSAKTRSIVLRSADSGHIGGGEVGRKARALRRTRPRLGRTDWHTWRIMGWLGYPKEVLAAWANTGLNLLKAMSPYAWVLALVASLASLGVAIKILSLQLSGNRPEIIFTRMDLRDPYDEGLFDIGVTNVGRAQPTTIDST